MNASAPKRMPAEPVGLDQNSQSLIGFDVLNRRIQDELLQLVLLSAEVQIGIGPALLGAKTVSPAMQRSLQAIDRLHQTLDDLARVMGHIAMQSPNSGVVVDELSQIIKLRHLAHKLFDDVDSPFALSDEDSGDISWF